MLLFVSNLFTYLVSHPLKITKINKIIIFFRCDSFGNRPVTAPSSSAGSSHRNRVPSFGSGRIRSDSFGNRQQTANNRSQRNGCSSSVGADNSYSISGNATNTRIGSDNHFMRKGIFKDSNPNNKVQSKEPPKKEPMETKLNSDSKKQ